MSTLPGRLLDAAATTPDRVAFRRKALGVWEETTWAGYGVSGLGQSWFSRLPPTLGFMSSTIVGRYRDAKRLRRHIGSRRSQTDTTLVTTQVEVVRRPENEITFR